jgi:hypothetical protein
MDGSRREPVGAAGVLLLEHETWKNGTLEEYRRDGATV